MVAHGLPKIKNHEEMGETWHENWGFPRRSALVAGITQVAGGANLVVGVFIRWSALLLMVNMLVATYAAVGKNREPFLGVKSKGWDINFLLLGALLAIAVGGGGPIPTSKPSDVGARLLPDSRGSSRPLRRPAR
jgi:uncharacterized membrane protein YphA (DoxX/SURF4 family)